ncbi:hypothetical protein PGT21_022606 [Puccinia graminis f. sp. tritici]|uniref:Uncharacterized protein n=1 Tax=Puccinia graminis f. sp. tritici TaxID=56615 RepID=A0A5B0R1V4_PUCGR|nr:hypothetical protein PGTUg99_007666 [Puccinia graminis f. sp. tritici]KAA1119339.1 hypothetical protein PGT21_022606 [Puccinia graminis f. sp. tritici]
MLRRTLPITTNDCRQQRQSQLDFSHRTGISMESPQSQAHKRAYSNLEDEPEGNRINDLLSRFKNLHAALTDPEIDDSFTSFLEDAKV